MGNHHLYFHNHLHYCPHRCDKGKDNDNSNSNSNNGTCLLLLLRHTQLHRHYHHHCQYYLLPFITDRLCSILYLQRILLHYNSTLTSQHDTTKSYIPPPTACIHYHCHHRLSPSQQSSTSVPSSQRWHKHLLRVEICLHHYHLLCIRCQRQHHQDNNTNIILHLRLIVNITIIINGVAVCGRTKQFCTVLNGRYHMKHKDAISKRVQASKSHSFPVIVSATVFVFILVSVFVLLLLLDFYST